MKLRPPLLHRTLSPNTLTASSSPDAQDQTSRAATEQPTYLILYILRQQVQQTRFYKQWEPTR